MKLISELPIRHGDETLLFGWPAFYGNMTFARIHMEEMGLKMAAPPQVASLLGAAWNDPFEEQESQILKCLQRGILEGSSNVYFTGRRDEKYRDGVVVINDPEWEIPHDLGEEHVKYFIREFEGGNPLIKIADLPTRDIPTMMSVVDDTYLRARYGDSYAKIANVMFRYPDPHISCLEKGETLGNSSITGRGSSVCSGSQSHMFGISARDGNNFGYVFGYKEKI
jgi:hypothetical protein